VASLGFVVGQVVADFELGFGHLGKRPPSSSAALMQLQNDSAWAFS
jgi:hypothetical protein